MGELEQLFNEILNQYESLARAEISTRGSGKQSEYDEVDRDLATWAERFRAVFWGRIADPWPALHREELGRAVRSAWIAWASEQHSPKPSWLTPWEELSESDKEADRRIGEEVAHLVFTMAMHTVKHDRRG